MCPFFFFNAVRLMIYILVCYATCLHTAFLPTPCRLCDMCSWIFAGGCLQLPGMLRSYQTIGGGPDDCSRFGWAASNFSDTVLSRKGGA